MRTIITLAKTLHMDVTAEGIETVDQLEILRALGCECGQGYLFAKPMEADAAFQLLTPQNWQKLLPAPRKPAREPALDVRFGTYAA